MISITFLEGVLTSVVAIFYLASWQLGAVEAISLSILVGTSVDYCVHLVEGYIMAGNSIPDMNSSKVCLMLKDYFQKFKVALNSTLRIFLTLPEVASYHAVAFFDL